MSNSEKSIQQLIRARAKEIAQKLENAGQTIYEKDSDGVPQPKNFPEALVAIKELLESNRRLFSVVNRLEAALPKKEETKFSPDELGSLFLTGRRYDDLYESMFGMSPPSIAILAINDFVNDQERFEIIDPNALQWASQLEAAYEPPKLTYTSIEIGGKQYSAPISNEFWLKDKKNGCNYILTYQPSQGGAIAVKIMGDYEFEQEILNVVKELKLSILQSPMIRGQIIEMQGGSDFRVVDIGEQPFPVISDKLRHELETNVINLFQKKEEFEKYGLPLKRSVILAGPPGCGKTMIERWLASQVRGEVTTIWVTAKSIEDSYDVASVFEIARKLSPALVIMEDLDLIAGTRQEHIFGNRGASSLGEMLNQLDGLTPNESIVLIGSTNSVASLDSALSERPGRFDRIYEVGKPEPEHAVQIAAAYLKSRGVDDSVIEGLNFSAINKGDFTGAQIVEIVKGAIFNAINLGKPVSDRMLASSAQGLEEQRRLLKGNK